MFEEENKEVLEENSVETEATKEESIDNNVKEGDYEEIEIIDVDENGDEIEDDDIDEEKGKEPCVNCGDCCNHIAIELDKPEDFDEFTEIIWYLMHKNIIVGIDHEDDWYIEIKTDCKARVDGKCAIYELRPQICRDYKSDEGCEYHGEGSAWKHEWHSREDFLNYLKEHNPEMYEKVINPKNYKE